MTGQDPASPDVPCFNGSHDLRARDRRAIRADAIPRLQRFGHGNTVVAVPFFFEPWQRGRVRHGGARGDRLDLLPGVPEALLATGPLLRRIIEQEWLAFRPRPQQGAGQAIPTDATCKAVVMANTWWSITVELVSSRGEYFWPRPGRVLIARPGWTFRVLAEAINTAFGRWDLAHLHAFILADGTRITMRDPWGEDFGGLDDTSTTLTRLQAGEVFAFTFDYGDGWDHLCTVDHAKVDAEQVAGIVPDWPIPIFGWGALPDQHGRAWAGDDGSGWVPPQPDPPTGDLPRILHDWGPQDGLSGPAAEEVADELAGLRAIRMGPAQPWDDAAVRDLRGAVARRELGLAERLLTARDVGDVAQQAAPVLILLARRRGGASRALCRQAIDALQDRGWPGDRELAIELTAALGEGRDLMSVPVPVDLDVLAAELDRNPVEMEGGSYLDLRDGGWVCVDESLTGEPAPEDLDDDERWLRIEPHDRNEGWHDMSLFIEYVEDGELAAQLDEAISGRGAFRRFGDTLRRHEEEWQRWQLVRQERALGRTRLWLEMHDVRPEV